jgi:hypothetical protein
VDRRRRGDGGSFGFHCEGGYGRSPMVSRALPGLDAEIEGGGKVGADPTQA